jgi:hypothetical protein
LKRRSLEKRRIGPRFIPANSLADKPMGVVREFSKRDVSRITRTAFFWSTAWAIAIITAAVKLAQRLDGERTPPLDLADQLELGTLVGSRHESVTELFALVLSLTEDQYSKARGNLHKLLPAFKSICAPIAIFIDNVDEHFRAHLERPDTASKGIIDKQIWYGVQTGLAMAIRDLHTQNQHVEIYASMRGEAIATLLHESEFSQDMDAWALGLEYNDEDLRHIYIRNLQAETARNCVSPGARDAFDRFFGSEVLRLENLDVGESEPIFEYVLRHTLRRPRDLMHVGSTLSKLPPAERSEANVRRCINDSAAMIASNYLGQIKGHLSHEVDFPVLFELIDCNILTRAQLEAVSKSYNERVNAREYVHVFCALFKAGLLGYLTRDVGTGHLIQRFEKPGERLFGPDGILPQSTHYIIHPVLDFPIRLRARQYTHDTLNIAGHGRGWRDSKGSNGVIKADVVGYSRILEDPVLSRTFSDDFATLVSECAGELASYRVGDGDAIWLEDRNPAKVLAAVRGIGRHLFASRYHAYLRAGAEFGFTATFGGPVYRTADRLRTATEPNILCVTREFSDAVEAIDGRIPFRPGGGATINREARVPWADLQHPQE